MNKVKAQGLLKWPVHIKWPVDIGGVLRPAACGLQRFSLAPA
jgi:hypothetical protein